MNQSTLLISRFLIKKYPHLKELSGEKLTDCLHRLLRDNRLWDKLRLLQSKKYTKTYQPVGQMLKRVDFYPFPEDWCFLSILSNGTGYSRCFLFIYLLEYDLGERQLEDDGTPDTLSDTIPISQYFCEVGLDFRRMIYARTTKSNPLHPQLPQTNIIHL